MAATRTLRAGQRMAALLSEVFPALAQEDRRSGYFIVTTSRPAATVALIGTRALSALAAIPVTSSPDDGPVHKPQQLRSDRSFKSSGTYPAFRSPWAGIDRGIQAYAIFGAADERDYMRVGHYAEVETRGARRHGAAELKREIESFRAVERRETARKKAGRRACTCVAREFVAPCVPDEE